VKRRGFPDKWFYDGRQNRWVQPTPSHEIWQSIFSSMASVFLTFVLLTFGHWCRLIDFPYPVLTVILTWLTGSGFDVPNWAASSSRMFQLSGKNFLFG
jgi:hypothetical protein